MRKIFIPTILCLTLLTHLSGQILNMIEIQPQPATTEDSIEVIISGYVIDTCIGVVNDEIWINPLLEYTFFINLYFDFISDLCLGNYQEFTHSIWLEDISPGSYDLVAYSFLFDELFTEDYGSIITWLNVLEPIYGCTDPMATNYVPEATTDDGSCIYDLLGDLDENESLNVLDVIQMVNLILALEYSFIADMNTDGAVDVLDVVQLVEIILNEN